MKRGFVADGIIKELTIMIRLLISQRKKQIKLKDYSGEIADEK